jgi:hypothetical protein
MVEGQGSGWGGEVSNLGLHEGPDGAEEVQPREHLLHGVACDLEALLHEVEEEGYRGTVVVAL